MIPKTLRAVGIGCSVLAFTACSESTKPAPTIAGTWHVTVQSLDSGSLSPSSFSVTITPVTESTFAVVMPPLVWSVGVTYDTIAQIGHYQGDSPDSTLSFEEWCRSLTCFISFRARMNQARDSLSSISLLFFDTLTTNNTLWLQNIPWAGGRFVAYK